jgi:hypothetical protein
MTEEEKVADKLANLVSDLRLDIEQVGVFVGRAVPATTYRRLQVITESAKHEKEQSGIRLINIGRDE